MKGIFSIFVLFVLFEATQLVLANPKVPSKKKVDPKFPVELVEFETYEKNPVFSGSITNNWDQEVRERGFILKEGDIYHMWYTGYNKKDGKDTERHLGLATSLDGLNWTRHEDNPIFDSCMVEDMCVVKSKGTYFMFAEGRQDIAHLLTSVDRIHWKEQGSMDIRYKNGRPLSKGPYGTPAVWLENGRWYLFYERDDLGIWLATSTDLKVWTNLQDEPVIQMGPEAYDKYAIAVDQIIKYKGTYYAYYHASEFKDWHEWSSCVAKSDDLVHWIKYSGNPILRENKSSPIVVYDGAAYRLYTMHSQVCVHFPKKSVSRK